MLRNWVLGLALLGLASPLAAQETLTDPGPIGCDSLKTFAWTSLAPGAKWEGTVDLSQCPSAQLGWYRYYGWMVKGKNNDTLKGQDGVVLSVRNPLTGEAFTSDAAGKSEAYLMIQVGQPARLQVSATNTGKQTMRISLTWLSMTR